MSTLHALSFHKPLIVCMHACGLSPIVLVIVYLGSDFTALDTTLSIYSNSRTKCASIPINYDYVPENYEEFTVSLSAGAGLPSYVTLSPASATVRIYNRHSECTYMPGE